MLLYIAIKHNHGMKYTLEVTATNNKSGKFLYQVKDENGTIISNRRSNREYVACTIDGSYYFGRIDLIGKGDHGKHKVQTPIAYK